MAGGARHSTRDEAWRTCAEIVWLPDAAEMAALDRSAVESGATTERTLIEAAGREVAREVARRWPDGAVVGLVGSGHNGADTLVALRTLRAWGREVRAVRCGSALPEPDVTAGWDVPVTEADALGEAREGVSVMLDGILGTGVRGAPREPQAEIIHRVNGTHLPVVAVDGPSGVDFTDGSVPGACVEAELTVCLGWPKIGLLLHPARQRCGEVVAVEIGFPPADPEPAARAVTGRWVRRMLRRREPTAHKGDAGYVTVVAGQAGMAGAAVLAARGAARGGAGVVRVVSAPENRRILQTAVPDAVFSPWDDGAAVADAVEWCDALAVGPGLGPGRRALVEEVLDGREGKPAVVDADGLNAWAGDPDALARLARGTLLTPHPGELARILEMSPAEIVREAPRHARETADRMGTAVLLKGAPSLVAEPVGPLRVATTGGPAVASGGSGDVLAGLSAALLAAGLTPADAGSAALFLSGVAAGRSPAPEGHLASDVPDRLPGLRRELGELPPSPEGPVVFALPAVPG